MERYFLLDKYNTYSDWGLILTAKDVTPPVPKEHLIELDGMSGSLDLSESLTGEITYKNRTVSATFWTDNGTFKDREKLLHEITKAIHGKKIKIVEPDYPEHYFYGRVKIKSKTNTLTYLSFTIEATCDPWRYRNHITRRRIDIGVDSDNPITIVINNRGAKTIYPIIESHASANMTYNGVSTTLYNGYTYEFPDIKIQSGISTFTIYGYGYIEIRYQEADL